jgi:hypothetical protein
MKPLLWTFRLAFGCRHGQLTRPFTINKRTYQVCIECGQEFAYSWNLMHTIKPGLADKTDLPLNGGQQFAASAL